ncbi:response regulator transcription factor [Chitinophaga varians]|uniref:DNA-binding response regulator n=4 Tax=Chitinophaga TaxID=79328 RepID=A0A365Y0T4_9BACT|nr:MULTISPECIES: response regulator transcription factor [Chitinophaga]NSL87432.1 response regulator transcription factor [Chitinophaga solisilvae]MBC9913296.1 response regulator transcription factor [Chitinophaga varians]NLR62866.1 response regulator transcription factor [Chitinophaga varians]NML38338.1 response regulator transcription factor [Chitinophaga fulva]RBL91534.1 DNA-binding response regulator [Chitinophaga flava]
MTVYSKKKSQDNMDIISIAIVEDNHDIRTAMELLINGSDGYACVGTFNNAETALEQIPQLLPNVVLMDFNLPGGMNGIECIARLKAEYQDMQFMMLTVYEDDDKIFMALEAGASGYILKKTSPGELLEAIRDLHEGGSPMSSQIARRVVAFFQKQAKPNPALEALTTREKEILDQLSKGFLYKEIASNLFISIETVRRHVHNIYEKLHVRSRTDAVNKYYNR